MNPFSKASFIRVGVGSHEVGFFIEIEPEAGHDLIIYCGDVVACVGLLKTNQVRHFDMLSSLADSPAMFSDFAAEATNQGFDF
jgi:hypothetical protein